MTHPVCTEDASKLELLRQLFAAATYDASAAMCCWTNNLIALTLDEVCEVPLAEACLALNLGEDRLTMVVMNLEGELGGVMVLMFSEENGRQLASSLLGCEPSSDPEWDEMERSALCETGNILSGAYMNAITRLIDRPLVPSVPYFIQDFGASVLEQAMLPQVSGRDTMLICHTSFQCANESLKWRVLFVPTVALRMAMEHAMPSHT
jgi:chemotaxis protein CheC